MLSRVIPLEHLKERDLMFWLPPGGQDNDVWADTWVIIAELESADAEPVLALLRDADVGAYIASPSGLKGAVNRGVQLYVDREQHSRAVDVLMLFLRKKDQPAAPVKTTRKPAPAAPAAHPKIKPRAIRILLTVIKTVVITAFIALALVLVYYKFFTPMQHPPSTSNAPGITSPGP